MALPLPKIRSHRNAIEMRTGTRSKWLLMRMEASGRAISAHARLLNSGRNADLIRPEESTRLILFADTVLTPAGVTWSPRGPPGRDKIDHPREAHDVGIALSQQARRSRLWQIERIMASWPDRPAGSTRLSDAPPRECNFANSRNPLLPKLGQANSQ